MADTKQAAVQSVDAGLTLSDVALELFKGRSQHAGVNPRQLAINCFRDAKIFLEVEQEADSGKLDLVEKIQPLDPAFAPNLKRTHPINLMSSAWGDLEKVKSVLAELEANPMMEVYPQFEWGKPEVNQARALFPAVVSKAKQLANAK